MPTVLITQCIQHDFIGPLSPQDPLPNLLHVGWEEARRLLGDDPEHGPVAQIIEWARGRDDVAVIHVRDWHDASDPAQQAHLQMFGEHCVQDTPGAALVLGLADDAEDHGETLVDAIGLSDFEGTRLPEVLDGLSTNDPLRVGVIGVWTEAKVTFLLYDLVTRANVSEVATCSALTASNSRGQHFNALDQLDRILGVRVFDAVGAFAQWLGADDDAPVLGDTHTPAADTPLEFTRDVALEDGDNRLLAFLYRESSRVVLDPLSGGFSGAVVFKVASWDRFGHQQAPSVAKLGPRQLVSAERVAFERVEGILGNNAPSVRGFVDHGERAGIKYSYAAMGPGGVSTFKKVYEGGATEGEIARILDTTFGEILERFYAAARYERLPLLEHYGFAPRHAAGLRTEIGALLGPDQRDAETLTFPDGQVVPSVAGFYEGLESLPSEPGYHYVSLVHGDLNGANIVIDGRGNIWLIDFFHTAPGHVLKDLAKLENDLLYILTPVTAETWPQAVLITEALAAIRDLQAPLPEVLEGLEAPQFRRAWATLRMLRRHIARLCREDRDPLQMHIAALRYAAHTLFFEESSELQRQWALRSACTWAERIQQTLRLNHRLRVDWLDPISPSGSRLPDADPWLGMTLCPGRKDRQRVLDHDLATLRDLGVTRLVSMVTDEELEWAGVSDLVSRAEGFGIGVLRAPVPDQGVPGVLDMRRWVDQLRAWRVAGDKVVIHCMGGLGRTGTLAGCFLVDHGVPADRAIARVRDARSPRAIETLVQETFVQGFGELSST